MLANFLRNICQIPKIIAQQWCNDNSGYVLFCLTARQTVTGWYKFGFYACFTTCFVLNFCVYSQAAYSPPNFVCSNCHVADER